MVPSRIELVLIEANKQGVTATTNMIMIPQHVKIIVS